MNTVIKVENLSKQYRLGSVGTGSFADDLNRKWHSIRGKEDPYLKLSEGNDQSVKRNSEYVWALQRINFEVEQGDVLGIIGRNGAGKSSLLKILSRTTAPTTGLIKIKGRIASLLEVGTGFHPELSGRENVFLNGAILGMNKKEIKKKFDEIVEFSGVDRFIDTPVKRYSSGMYVRLAFSVAAFLESEILIVDEVLAVGDSEFQKKCLSKMNEVSKWQGRTVLFVSHNLIALQKICTKGIMLNQGELISQGILSSVVNNYVGSTAILRTELLGENIEYNQVKIKLIKAWIKFNAFAVKPLISDAFDINIEFEVKKAISLNISLVIYTKNEEHLLSNTSLNDDGSNYNFGVGRHKLKCKIPPNFFNTGLYHFTILFVEDYSIVLLELDRAFSVELDEDLTRRGNFIGPWNGVVRPKWNWFLNGK
jgi:lipopolysaccharide transport system ATP-binding protein